MTPPKGHAASPSKCSLCKDNSGKLIMHLIPLNHPNSRSRTGLTFNQEIANAIAKATAWMGYCRGKGA